LLQPISRYIHDNHLNKFRKLLKI